MPITNRKLCSRGTFSFVFITDWKNLMFCYNWHIRWQMNFHARKILFHNSSNSSHSRVWKPGGMCGALCDCSSCDYDWEQISWSCLITEAPLLVLNKSPSCKVTSLPMPPPPHHSPFPSVVFSLCVCFVCFSPFVSLNYSPDLVYKSVVTSVTQNVIFLPNNNFKWALFESRESECQFTISQISRKHQLSN